MYQFTAADAAKACNARIYDPAAGKLVPWDAFPDWEETGKIPLTDLCTDSREAQTGCLFAAIPGERVDGHQFIPAALEKGAAAVLSQRPDLAGDTPDPRVLQVENTLDALLQIAAAYRSRFLVRLAAVTGSVGKTTTKEMIWTALSCRYNTLKTQGNQNNEIGLPRTLLRLLPEHEAAVAEMGMSGLNEIRPLSLAARPCTAVLTNIGVSHLEHLGSRENILRAKLEILEGLEPGGTLVVNRDNDLLGKWLEEQKGKDAPYQILTYGIEGEAELTAGDIRQTPSGCSFLLGWQGREYPARLPCVGLHNISNALAAVGAALTFGIPPEESLRALESFVPSGMRQHLVTEGGVCYVEDCYNASPDSMRAAFAALAGMECPEKNGRKILVLADMLELGSIEIQAHHEAGREAAHSADMLLAYGTLAKEYISGAKEAGMENANWYPDRETLAAALKKTLRPGDMAWFKGSRGMELEKVLEAVRRGGEEAGR
ncbi:MAG: UDP-N-acetylmuramoyl-tripeptide--D-alanyl-D-alanine ligase [Oscillospiraceae bacterium]|jgi:UDP-N-acetylmuramoyl-tripeptide--D-alanyl-D-alanine ligase|nr:UDP-N-acetylmuramoyl-tripeptide--D-alanyl-D-alanine ligase [Oscillospiraceae bacterium]